jgi:hypothetical protein
VVGPAVTILLFESHGEAGRSSSLAQLLLLPGSVR